MLCVIVGCVVTDAISASQGELCYSYIVMVAGDNPKTILLHPDRDYASAILVSEF